MKWIILLVLIGAGIGGYLLFSNGEETTPTNTNSTTGQETDRQSIENLIAAGGNVMCSYSDEGENNSSTGTVYISGENMRGDFSLNTEEGTITSHMIRDGNMQYVWQDGLDEGYSADLTAITDEENSEAVDTDKDFDFNCQSWSVDESLFNLPDINFVDLTEQIEQVEEDQQTAEDIQREACNQLQDDAAKKACLQAL